MDTKFFTHDEVIMLRFIGICQPSLDPERYEAVLDACATLCENRKGLTPDSITKCLEHLNGLQSQ